jgi:hypothetical protein
MNPVLLRHANDFRAAAAQFLCGQHAIRHTPKIRPRALAAHPIGIRLPDGLPVFSPCVSRVLFALRRSRRVRSAPSARRRAEQTRRGTRGAPPCALVPARVLAGLEAFVPTRQASGGSTRFRWLEYKCSPASRRPRSSSRRCSPSLSPTYAACSQANWRQLN